MAAFVAALTEPLAPNTSSFIPSFLPPRFSSTEGYSSKRTLSETYDPLCLEGSEGNSVLTEKERGDGYSDKRQFILPTKGWLSSGYGYRQHPMGGDRKFHGGIDIAASRGTPVYASANGTVIFADELSLAGKTIFIRHRNGYETRYLHLSTIEVKKGKRVKQGDRIASVGSTGRSTGPHLHFEIRKHGSPLDPMNFLPPKDEW